MEDLCADCVGKTISRRLCFRFILVPVLASHSSYAIVLRDLFVVVLRERLTATDLFLFAVADIRNRGDRCRIRSNDGIAERRIVIALKGDGKFIVMRIVSRS